MESALKAVSPDTDAMVVVERFKSGDVPPGDFKFEDMRDPQVSKEENDRQDLGNLSTMLKLARLAT